MVGVVNVNDVDDGRTGTAQHNGQWPAKVLINILCPVHTHAHTHTSTHSHLYTHILGQAVALLMFYESRFVCKFVGPQTPKNCNNIWQMFPFCCSPPSARYTALSNCANSPNSWVLCAFPCYYYAMLSCASSHSPQRKLPVFNLANGRRLLHAAGVAPANPKYGFQIPNPIYPLLMPLSLPSFHLYSWPFFPLQTNSPYIFPFSDKEQQ